MSLEMQENETSGVKVQRKDRSLNVLGKKKWSGSTGKRDKRAGNDASGCESTGREGREVWSE